MSKLNEPDDDNDWEYFDTPLEPREEPDMVDLLDSDWEDE
jgi:hypothetical protein